MATSYWIYNVLNILWYRATPNILMFKVNNMFTVNNKDIRKAQK